MIVIASKRVDSSFGPRRKPFRLLAFAIVHASGYRSESLVKLFRDPSAKLQRDAIFQHFPGYLGAGADSWRTTPVSLIQIGDWKLMEFLEDGHLELYNLADDIGETKNLAMEMPDKAKALHARLVAWRAEVNAPMPSKNDGESAKPRAKGKGKKKAA